MVSVTPGPSAPASAELTAAGRKKLQGSAPTDSSVVETVDGEGAEEKQKNKHIVQRCGKCPSIPFVLELVPCCYLLYYVLRLYKEEMGSEVEFLCLVLGIALLVPYPLFEVVFFAGRSCCLGRMAVGSYSMRVPQASLGFLGILWWPTRRVLLDPPPFSNEAEADAFSVTRTCRCFGRWGLGPRAATAVVAEVPPEHSASGINFVMPLAGDRRFFPKSVNSLVVFCPSVLGDHVLSCPSFDLCRAKVCPVFDGDHVFVSAEHDHAEHVCAEYDRALCGGRGGCCSDPRAPVWAKRGCCAAAPLRKLLLLLGSLGLVLLLFAPSPRPTAKGSEKVAPEVSVTRFSRVSEVVFLLDTSSSMTRYVSGVREQMINLHDKLQQARRGQYEATFATFDTAPQRHEEVDFRRLTQAKGVTNTLTAFDFVLRQMFPQRDEMPQPRKQSLFIFTDGQASDFGGDKDAPALDALLHELRRRQIFLYIVCALPEPYSPDNDPAFFVHLRRAFKVYEMGEIFDIVLGDEQALDEALQHFVTEVVTPPEPALSVLSLLLSVLPFALWWIVLNACCWPREAEMD